MNRKKIRIILREIYDSSSSRKREILRTGNEENLYFLRLMVGKINNLSKKLDTDSKENLLLSKTRQIYLECILHIQTKPNSSNF